MTTNSQGTHPDGHFPDLNSMKTMHSDGASQSGGQMLGRIDQYDLVEKLGDGGFGVVYLAKDTISGIEVALKTLPYLKSDTAKMDALRKKFSLAARLTHENIAKALVLHRAGVVDIPDETVRGDMDLSPGDPVMVMDFAPGIPLSRWRLQFPGGTVPPEQTIEIARQIASALDYAHGRGIIHRDIKPANIMVETLVGQDISPSGPFPTVVGICARLLDFGLAAEICAPEGRLSANPDEISGTLPYMAPEQWSGLAQDGSTDQYGLACMLYELLSGKQPFAHAVWHNNGEVDKEVLRLAVLQRQPPPLKSISTRANAAFARALAKTPKERFPSCASFVEELAVGLGVRSGSGSRTFAETSLPNFRFPTEAVDRLRSDAANAARRSLQALAARRDGVAKAMHDWRDAVAKSRADAAAARKQARAAAQERARVEAAAAAERARVEAEHARAEAAAAAERARAAAERDRAEAERARATKALRQAERRAARAASVRRLRAAVASLPSRLAVAVWNLPPVAAVHRHPRISIASALAVLVAAAFALRGPHPPVPGRNASLADLAAAKDAWIEFRSTCSRASRRKYAVLCDRVIPELDLRIAGKWRTRLAELQGWADTTARSLDNYRQWCGEAPFKTRFDDFDRGTNKLAKLVSDIPTVNQAGAIESQLRDAARWIQDNALLRRRLVKPQKDYAKRLDSLRSRYPEGLDDSSLSIAENSRISAERAILDGEFSQAETLYDEAIRQLDDVGPSLPDPNLRKRLEDIRAEAAAAAATADAMKWTDRPCGERTQAISDALSELEGLEPSTESIARAESLLGKVRDALRWMNAYNAVHRETDSARNLYESLLAMIEKSGVSQHARTELDSAKKFAKQAHDAMDQACYDDAKDLFSKASDKCRAAGRKTMEWNLTTIRTSGRTTANGAQPYRKWTDKAYASRHAQLVQMVESLGKCTNAESIAEARALTNDIARIVAWMDSNAPARATFAGLRETVEKGGKALEKDFSPSDLDSVGLAVARTALARADDLCDEGKFADAKTACEGAVKLLEQARTTSTGNRQKRLRQQEEKEKEALREAEENRLRKITLAKLWTNTVARANSVRSCENWKDPFFATRCERFAKSTNVLASAIAAGDVEKATKAADAATILAEQMATNAPARRLLAREEEQIAGILRKLDRTEARRRAQDLCAQADNLCSEAARLRDCDNPDFATAAASFSRAANLYQQAMNAPISPKEGDKRTLRLRDRRDPSGKTTVDLTLTWDGCVWKSGTITQDQWLAIDETNHRFSRQAPDLPADFLNTLDIDTWIRKLAGRPECAGWQFEIGETTRHTAATAANARNLSFSLHATTKP